MIKLNFDLIYVLILNDDLIHWTANRFIELMMFAIYVLNLSDDLTSWHMKTRIKNS